MRDLHDYSGAFIPDLKLGDFTHDTLVKILNLYSQLYIAMDGFWYLAVMEKYGNEEALACDMLAWEKAAKYEIKRIAEALNIKNRDVTSFMKAMQLTPWCQKMKYSMELIDQDKAVFTVTYCPTLDALEKEGKGRQIPICREIEPKILEWYATFFNPEIKFESLSPLPRKNKNDVCCKWSIYKK